jgi:hypothetical protein
MWDMCLLTRCVPKNIASEVVMTEMQELGLTQIINYHALPYPHAIHSVASVPPHS